MFSHTPTIGVELQMTRSVTDGYRPHLRVGDGEYLGISFFDVNRVSAGDCFHAKASLMYWPNVDYSCLKAGTKFQVVEGGLSVGQGKIVIGWDENV
jgi:hypothetical protein